MYGGDKLHAQRIGNAVGHHDQHVTAPKLRLQHGRGDVPNNAYGKGLRIERAYIAAPDKPARRRTALQKLRPSRR